MNEKTITYYKKESNYPNDNTKKCGLTGEEIDNNFFFLRGFDISSISLNKEDGKIILNRVNGETLEINSLKDYIESLSINDIDLSGTTFDAEKGILTLSINGTELLLTGFTNTTDITNIIEEFECVKKQFEELNESVSGATTNLETEIKNRISGDTELNKLITQEETERTKADSIIREDLENEISERKSADEAIYKRINEYIPISGQSHTHENKTVLDGITAVKVAAWDSAEANAKKDIADKIAALDAEVSGTSNGVEVTVKETDGKLESVTVTAPKFDTIYEKAGAAAQALIDANVYTNEKIKTESESREQKDDELTNFITSTKTELQGEIDTLSGSSHTHENKTVLDGITTEKVTAWDSAEDNANKETDKKIAALNAEVRDVSHGVVISVEQSNGKLKGITVNAPDFAGTYETKAEATAKIEALNATVSGECNGVEVTVKETAGKLKNVSVIAPDFKTIYETKEEAKDTETEFQGKIDTLSGSSHTHENKTVLDGITSDKVTAWDSAEDNANKETDKKIAALNAEVSGESNEIKVTVKETNGKLESVSVSALNFATKDELQGEIKSLSERINQTAIIKDIIITPNNPLYSILNNLWNENKITSGTTLTEFVENLLTMKDNRKIYYGCLFNKEETWKNFCNGIILDTTKMKNERNLNERDKDNKIEITIEENTYTIGIAIPFDKDLLSVVGDERLNEELIETFNKTIVITPDNVKYKLYYCKTEAATMAEKILALKIY